MNGYALINLDISSEHQFFLKCILLEQFWDGGVFLSLDNDLLIELDD